MFQKELKTGENNFMKIKLEKGKTGIKTIKLTKMYKKQNEWKFENLPKLMVPEDAYNFVRALDRIIMACSGEQIFDEKSEIFKVKFWRGNSDKNKIFISFILKRFSMGHFRDKY